MTAPGDAGRGARPPFGQLLDWVEGRCLPADAARIQAIVDGGDEDVLRTITWIEGFIEFGRRRPYPPPLLRQRLRQSFQRHHAGGAR